MYQPGVDAFEGACCWGCRTRIVQSNPEALRLLVSTGITREIALASLDNPTVAMLRAAVGDLRWPWMIYHARRQVTYYPMRRNTRALHEDFGQSKYIKFIYPSPFEIRPENREIEKGTVLEIVCREHDEGKMMELFDSMAKEIVEPHYGLQFYQGLNVEKVLKPVIMFNLGDEIVTILQPHAKGWTATTTFLPGRGTDLYSLHQRVNRYLWGCTNGWRAIFIQNIWGLGNLAQRRERQGYPLFHHWITTLMDFPVKCWIIIGAVIPNKQEYFEETSWGIIMRLNYLSTHRHVQFLNLAEPNQLYDILYWEDYLRLLEERRQQRVRLAVVA